MNKNILITTDNPAIYDLLKFVPPDGIQIISDRPTGNRIGDQIPLTFELDNDIQVVVDTATVNKYVLATWLLSRIRVTKGNHKININREQIFPNDPDAKELIINEIENE